MIILTIKERFCPKETAIMQVITYNERLKTKLFEVLYRSPNALQLKEGGFDTDPIVY